MKKHFYTHLIEIDSLFISLDLLDMKKEEREELMLIIESTVHHAVVDVVLTELSHNDKKVFLSHLAHGKHDDIWTLLKAKTKNIEDKIHKAAHSVKESFHKDI